MHIMDMSTLRAFTLYFPNGCSGILPIHFYGACDGLPLEVLDCMSTHGYKHRLQNIWRPLTKNYRFAAYIQLG